MKLFKNLVLILTLATVIVTSTSCNKDKDEPQKELSDSEKTEMLMGIWKVVEANGTNKETIHYKDASKQDSITNTTYIGKDFVNAHTTFTRDSIKGKGTATFIITTTINNGTEEVKESVVDFDIFGASPWHVEDNALIYRLPGNDKDDIITIKELTESKLILEMVDTDYNTDHNDNNIENQYANKATITYKKQ